MKLLTFIIFIFIFNFCVSRIRIFINLIYLFNPKVYQKYNIIIYFTNNISR